MPQRGTEGFGRGSIYNTSSWKRGAIRNEVLDSTGGRCARCGVLGKRDGGPATIVIDHKIPARVLAGLGRADGPWNWQPLCNPCSGKKDGGRRYR